MIDNVSIDDLIPHRDGMRLVERIIYCESDRGSTASVVSERWPMVRDGAVSPVIFIELAAQTAGVVVGYDELKKTGKKMMGRGWIVGVKSADFSVAGIPVGTTIITEIMKKRAGESYTEIEGWATIDGITAGRVLLQAFRAD